MASSAIKSSFYKWHRVLGLIGLVPVIGWTLSGLSHPFMSNWFRPTIAKEVFKPLPQSKMQPALSVKQVMDKNNLHELRNFNLIHFNKGHLLPGAGQRQCLSVLLGYRWYTVIMAMCSMPNTSPVFLHRTLHLP
jgi:hypothetical protein